MEQIDRAPTGPRTVPKGDGPGLVRFQDVMSTATRIVVLKRTALHCRAEHPAARKIHRFTGRMHMALIQVVPFACEPTKRVLSRHDEVRADCIGVYCPDCKAITEYELVAAEAS